mgnify:CR=1 FL=1
MSLPQGISRSGFFSPVEGTDGILHSITLKGGYQEMLTKEDRNNIKSFLNIDGAVYDGFTQSKDVWSTGRRRVGMMIYVVEDGKLYNLIPIGFFGNEGDLGIAEWTVLPEWERALRMDPSGAFTSESASPLNGFTPTIKTAADLGLPSNADSCWVELQVGVNGLNGSDGSPGQNSYIHIAYANDTNGSGFSKTESNDKLYIGQYTDFDANGSTDHTKYTWSQIKGDKGDAGDDGLDGLQGDKGDDGIQGPKGDDGLPTYFHIAYADDASGTNFSQDAEGKLYIGTYVDGTEADGAFDDIRWKWQLVKGLDGANGIPGNDGSAGADGQTSYLHLAYANDSNGLTGFSVTDSDNKLYIGQYTDFTLEDSDDPAVYLWTRIKGEQGDKGDAGLDGLQGVKGDAGIAGPKGADGVQTYFHIAYADDASGGNFSQQAEGKLYIGTYVDDEENDADYNSPLWKWQLVKGLDGANGLEGSSGLDGSTSYLHIAYANNTSGLDFSVEFSEGRDYIGQYTDYVLEDSNLWGNYKWSLIKGAAGQDGADGYIPVKGVDYFDGTSGTDGSDGDSAYNAWLASGNSGTTTDFLNSLVGADGPSGSAGVQGPAGADGTATYTWIRYADNGTGSIGFSNSPTGKKYIGFAFNKDTSVESDKYNEYTWSLIKGDKGDQGEKGSNGEIGLQGLQGSSGTQGIPGPTGGKGADGAAGPRGITGPDGQKGDAGVSSYFHIAYADTANGGGFSQSPTGKDYIGTYVDYDINDKPAGDSAWKWALVKGTKGDQGQQGVNGLTGATTYLHIAYANNTSGSNFDVEFSEGRDYIGQYTDTTLEDSDDYRDYTWSLIKGAKGNTGDDGPQGAKGSTGPQGAKGATGPAPDTSQYVTTSTNIDGGKITTGVLKSGDFNLAGADWLTYSPNGMAINLDNDAINAKNFYIDPSGNASFKGDLDVEGDAKIGGVLAKDFFDIKEIDGIDTLTLFSDVQIGEEKFSDYKESQLRRDDELSESDGGNDNIRTTLTHTYVKRNDVSIESGDLVKLDGNNELVKADSAKDTGIVGILWHAVDYSLKPNILDKYRSEPRVFVEKDHHYRDSFGVKLAEADRNTKSLWKVAALGDSVGKDLLGMKVCNQNGEVVIGDLLCSSDTPGYLMKQPVEYVVVNIVDGTPQYEERQVINSFTVGKCMASVNFDGNGKTGGVYGYLYCG